VYVFYGLCADALDEYCRISENTMMEYLKRFCVAIHEEFGDYHLKQHTKVDFSKQLAIKAKHGFTGMFASLEYMHYEWKNCLIVWQNDFDDKDGKKSIILELLQITVCTFGTYILDCLAPITMLMCWTIHL
jgi:hypothetical protein